MMQNNRSRSAAGPSKAPCAASTVLWCAVLSLLLLGSCVARADNPTVVFGTRHLTGANLPGAVFSITPVSLQTQTNFPIAIFTYTNVTGGADNTFTTVMVPGAYRVQIQVTFGGRFFYTSYTNCFADTNITLYTGDPANMCGATSISNTVAYTQAASDRRFVLRANGFATNLSLIRSNMALPSVGQVWTSIGTNGWGAWSNAVASSSSAPSFDATSSSGFDSE